MSNYLFYRLRTTENSQKKERKKEGTKKKERERERAIDEINISVLRIMYLSITFSKRFKNGGSLSIRRYDWYT